MKHRLSHIIAIGFLLMCNTVFAQSSFKPGSEPNGFRNHPWGSEINAFNAMKQVDISSNHTGIPQPPIDSYMLQYGKNYIKTDDSLEIDGVRVEKIIYTFWKNRLMRVAACINDKENFNRIKNALIDKYGATELQGSTGIPLGFYAWQGNTTIAVLSDYSELAGQAVLEFTSIHEQSMYFKDLRQNRKGIKE